MISWMLRQSQLIRWLMPFMIILAIVGMLSGSDEPIVSFLRDTSVEKLALKLHTGNTIIFNLCVGFLTGVFLWFLVSWIPEQRKRAILKSNLKRHYHNFKEDVIQILLRASDGSHDSDLPKQLSDYQKFQEFFRANQRKNWFAALNGLQENPDYLNDLLVELELLANEVSYALNNLNIADEEVHAYFKRLSQHIYRLKSSTVFTDDQVKYLGSFLWEILAQWSLIHGQRKSDIVQDIIERL